MKVTVAPFASAIKSEHYTGKTIVVIDVLRATSVMLTAFQNGAKQIIPFQSIDEAKQKAMELPKGSYLLCGERNAKKIEGFNLGNSPLEFIKENVADKKIIITTTNGTKALNICNEAKTIYVGAFLNVDAIVEKVKENEELILLCAGTQGKFSLDDALCAAMIMDGISKLVTIETDDLGYVLLQTWQSRKSDLKELLEGCFHLNYLIKTGYAKDVDFCLQTNTSELVPEFNTEEGVVKLF